MKKRIVSFLMALVMMTSLLPVQVFAADVDTPAAEPAAVAQEPAKDEEPAQEDPAPAEQTNETDETDTAVYAVDTPAAKFTYSPSADDVKVIGTYQVDENTTWDVRLLTVDSTQYNYIATSNAKTGTITTEKFAIGDSVSGKYTASHYKGSEVYGTGVQLYTQLKDSLKLTEALDADATQTCFYNLKYTGRGSSAKVSEIYGLLIIQWTAGELVMPDKTALQAAIDAAPKAEDGTYYTSNDKYDGKTTSSNGFWSEYQTALNNANRVNTNASAKQDAIDAAVTYLQAAIAKLIPTSLANTTVLYQELQKKPLSEESYTAKSWAAYQTVLDKAKALMATMFDAEGNPTDDNKAAAQESIEAMAAELKAAYTALNRRLSGDLPERIELGIEEIRYLAKRYDPDTLTGYTAESIKALRQARTAALELVDSIDLNDIGNWEDNNLLTQRRDLYKAVYGLETTSQEQISVKVSVLDAVDIYLNRTGKYAFGYNSNTYTATLTLDANASAYDLLNGKGLLKRYYSNAEALVFLNGELLYSYNFQDYSAIAYTNGPFNSLKLHDGDELTLVWIMPKMIKYSSGAGSYAIYLHDILDWIRYSTISAPVEVEAGKPFTISVTSETALPIHCAAGTAPVVGAKICRSGAGETPDAVANGYVGVADTYAVTDANGNATVTLYNEGYVLLNAFRTDDEGRYTAGPSVLVHVTASSDLAAVKKQLRAELDRRILYAGGPAVHALDVCPAAHLAGDVAVLVRVGVVEGPAGVGPGKGSGPAQAPTDDVRAVEGPHRPLCLVRLPVVDPQPPGVHLEHQAVVLAQCIVVAAVRSVLFVALDVVVLGVIGEAQAVARRDGLTDALDGGVLPCHLPVCLAEIAVARLAHAAEL